MPRRSAVLTMMSTCDAHSGDEGGAYSKVIIEVVHEGRDSVVVLKYPLEGVS